MFGLSFNNTFLHFPISLFALHISLQYSLSLSREHVQIIKNEATEKKNAYLKQQIIKKQQKKRAKWPISINVGNIWA